MLIWPLCKFGYRNGYWEGKNEIETFVMVMVMCFFSVLVRAEDLTNSVKTLSQ